MPSRWSLHVCLAVSVVCGCTPLAPGELPDGGFVPAAHAPLPQIVSLGGRTLQHPRIVPVFFGSDPLRSQIEGYLHGLAGSSYWAETTSEYGIAAPQIAASLVLSDAPPSVIHEKSAPQWLEALAAQSPTAWGQPAAETLYAIFPPASTVVTVPYEPDVCAATLAGGGFHASATVKGVTVAFAITARCAAPPGQTELDVYSATMSHELVEAVTDPVYDGYAQTDDASAAFQVGTWGEVCDLCEFAPQSEFRPPGVSGLSQRCWSNAAAAAGHDPCVPAIAQPYFNAAPVMSDTVALTWDGFTQQATGVRIPVGQSRTIDVELFSDAATPDWNVKAVDYASAYDGRAQALKLMLDATRGNNGTRLHLTITALRADPTYGGEIFVLESRGPDGVVRSSWSGVVGN